LGSIDGFAAFALGANEAAPSQRWPGTCWRGLRTLLEVNLSLWTQRGGPERARGQLIARLVAIIMGVGLVGCSAGPGTATGHPMPALTVTDANNGDSVSLQVGQVLIVQLSSTYWMLGGSSDPAVLAVVGSVQVAPSPGCVPGQGCGTVTARYRAVRMGRSEVTATRAACGEALPCTDGQGRFTVLVQVSG
jgi:hypothetical protein